MKIAFYGSSLVSAYWNGAATYYRGLLRALHGLGYSSTFFEPAVHDRQAHRDMDPPDWCRVVVFAPTEVELDRVTADAAEADIVVVASGIGWRDDDIRRAAWSRARQGAIRIFWDVDAPATLAALNDGGETSLAEHLPLLDAVLTYGGGRPIVERYRVQGARQCHPIYNALDPTSHFPVEPDPRFRADLAFLGNRLPDREERVEEFFFRPALRLPDRRFLIAGNGWDTRPMPANVRPIGHLYTADHNAFNSTPLAVSNVARADMAEAGYSPATRVFEALGAGACLISDAWPGIETFLAPGDEVLVARDSADVVDLLRQLTPARARQIGDRGRQRVLNEHTYASRANAVDRLFRRLQRQQRAREDAWLAL